MQFNNNKLDFFVSMGYNVLFRGRPGVGKTAIIHDTFKRNKLKYKYFSAPTMDPWTDLVGIPKTVVVENYNGKQQDAIELIPPADLVINQYDAIFIDELNRAPPKVMNALMELMQFKTINGKPYPFKHIWAAINPYSDDEEYHVEPLDPAFEDRFNVHINMPYTLDKKYLTNKHGLIAEPFINWWNEQPEAVKFKISPRRLDDSIKNFTHGGDITDTIYFGNISALETSVKNSGEIIKIETAFKENNIVLLNKLLSQNYSNTLEKYLLQKDNLDRFFPYINEDWINKKITSDSKFFNNISTFISDKNNNSVKAESLISDIVKTNPTSTFVLRNKSTLQSILSQEAIDIIDSSTKSNATFNLISNASDELADFSIIEFSHKNSRFTQSLYPLHSFPFSTTKPNNFHYNISDFNNFFNYSHFTTFNKERNKLPQHTKFSNDIDNTYIFCISVAYVMCKTLSNEGAIFNKVNKSLFDKEASNYFFGRAIFNNLYDNYSDKIKETIEKITSYIETNIPDATKNEKAFACQLIYTWNTSAKFKSKNPNLTNVLKHYLPEQFAFEEPISHNSRKSKI